MKNDSINNETVSPDATTPNAETITTSGIPQEPANTNDKPIKEEIDTPRPQRSRKKLLIVLVTLFVLILVAVATWFFLIYQPSIKDSSDEDGLSAATNFSSAKKLIDEVKPELNGVVMEIESYNGVSAVTTDSSVVYSAPAYKLANKEFTVLPTEATGLGYKGDSVAASANYTALKSFFEENKFKQIMAKKEGEAPISSFEKGVVIGYAEYESRNIVCSIRHIDASATDLKLHVSGLGCADKQVYEKAANNLQPFYDSYMTGGKGRISNIILGSLKVEQGAENYQRATVYIEDPEQFTEDEESFNHSINTLYYKKPNTEKWEYFTGIVEAPSQLSCSSYDSSAEAKKAFAGFACYDDKAQKESVVE